MVRQASRKSPLTERQWQNVVIENAELRCTFLPAKGGEITSLYHKSHELELLATLRDVPLDDDTHGLVEAGATELAFNRWYAGGWQELLPNGDAPCTVDGIEHSFHGESWGRAWRVVAQTTDSITMTVDLNWPPLRLQRTVALGSSPPAVLISEELTNTGPTAAQILWGHHPAFGAPLVAEGATIIAPIAQMETVYCDETSRLAAAGDLTWPKAYDKDGAIVDVSRVQAAAAQTHDLCLLHGFSEGTIGIHNPLLGLDVTLSFDATLFPWLWIWQLYGGAEEAPFAGAYCLALEPWSGPPTLTRAIADDSVLVLAPNESRSTTLSLTIEPSPQEITP